MIDKEQLKEFIHKETINAVLVNSSIDNWAKNLGINLRENQLEIMENILNPSIRDIVILASRSGGKTFTVSVAVVKQCVENRGYRVILVGPKADLSARIIKDGIVPICKGNSVLSAEVDWERTTQKEVVFKNGSWVRSLGGTENTQVEGYHCFVGNTPILLEDGTYKPIMDIAVGDKVISFDDSDNLVTGEVVDTNVRLPEGPLYEVSYKLNGVLKTVKCTGDHRFYTKNRGIVEAKDLTNEDTLIGVC